MNSQLRILILINCDSFIMIKFQITPFFNTRNILLKMVKYLRNIGLTEATGSDNIGLRLLKLAAPLIAKSLTYICNQTINISTFPDKWKEEKIKHFTHKWPKG